MLVVRLALLFLLCRTGNCDGSSLIPPDHSNPQLETCVGDILRKYFVKAIKVTYFYFGLEDDELLGYIHSQSIMGTTIRNCSQTKVTRLDRSYLIVAKNEDELKNVKLISMGGNWNPYARFLIVIYQLQDLDKVFTILLPLRIYKVVVINGTETSELYTYNPLENHACGKFYNRITGFGKCSNVESIDLYPDKVVTGLRNCDFTVSCPHWPPYSINPARSDDKPYEMGAEQNIFHIMSEVERFKYKFVYNYDPEMFSTVSQNMSVSGPMTMLQTNHVDAMLGGLVLTQSRARMFCYVHGHLDQVEELRLMVKRASTTPAWKNFYLEFSTLVWTLILLVSVFYAAILLMMLRTQDKGHVVLVLLDYLFLHGSKFQASQMVNVVFICWVWFAYLINCFYQSSLVSLTTKPSTEFQIEDEQTMFAHNLKPCISTVIKKVMSFEESTLAKSLDNDTKDKSCDTFLNSIKTVSRSKDRFTATLYTIYLYYKQRFYDRYGSSPMYSFSKPYTKVNYAIYLYKGFPMEERLQKLALRIRETGLTDKYLNYQYYLRAVKYKFHTHGRETRFAIPWYVFIIGICISSITFFVEIASRYTQTVNENTNDIMHDDHNLPT